MESGRVNRLEQLEYRIKSIEEKLDETNDTSNKKILNLKDQISKLQRQIEEEKSVRNTYYDAKEKDLKVIELKINEKFELLLQQRKEMERKLAILIEEKQAQLKAEIAKESSIRIENIDYLKACIEVEFNLE